MNNKLTRRKNLTGFQFDSGDSEHFSTEILYCCMMLLKLLNLELGGGTLCTENSSFFIDNLKFSYSGISGNFPNNSPAATPERQPAVSSPATLYTAKQVPRIRDTGAKKKKSLFGKCKKLKILIFMLEV